MLGLGFEMAKGAAVVAYIVEAADLGRVGPGANPHVRDVDAVKFDAGRTP